MNKYMHFSLVLFCILVLGIELHAREIAIASINYEPYYGTTLENDGFLGQIVREAFKVMGHTCSFTYYETWNEALSIAKEGKCDALLSVWYRQDREQFFYHSSPLPANVLVFYRKVGSNIGFKGWKSLKNRTIGGVHDYTYPDQMKKLNILYNKSDIANLQDLVQGKLDLVIIDKFQALYYLRTKLDELRGKIETIYPIITLKTQYLAFPKQNSNVEKNLIEFNTGLIRIQESGIFEKIKKKYGF